MAAQTIEDIEVLARLEFPCQMILQKRRSPARRRLTWPARALQRQQGGSDQNGAIRRF
jgi:hypothetical protein